MDLAGFDHRVSNMNESGFYHAFCSVNFSEVLSVVNMKALHADVTVSFDQGNATRECLVEW